MTKLTVPLGSVEDLTGGLARLTIPSGAAAGSSFPAGPTTGDRFWRTDLAIEFYWNGTYWLSTTLYTAHVAVQRALAGVTATTYLDAAFPHPTMSILTGHLLFSASVSSGNSGSAYWTCQISGSSAVASTANNGNVDWVLETEAMGEVLAPTTNNVARLEATITKVSNPGSLFFGVGITYRLIGA